MGVEFLSASARYGSFQSLMLLDQLATNDASAKFEMGRIGLQTDLLGPRGTVGLLYLADAASAGNYSALSARINRADKNPVLAHLLIAKAHNDLRLAASDEYDALTRVSQSLFPTLDNSKPSMRHRRIEAYLNAKIFDYLLFSAQTGVDACAYWVGKYFEEGIGTQIDISRAIYWYDISAKRQRYVPALLRLGAWYELQENVRGHFETAINYYRLAALEGSQPAYKTLFSLAEKGDAVAEYNLGIVILDKESNFGTTAAAVPWFERSSAQDYDKAKAILRTLSGASIDVGQQ